jgi:hypothetical protein
VAFIDRAKSLYINTIAAFSSGSDPDTLSEKLASQVNDISWNDECEILAAVSEKSLITWFYPRAALIDKHLLSQARSTKVWFDFGERPKISFFNESTIEIEFEDGSKIQNSIAQCALSLHEYAHENKWKQAQNLCQFMKAKEYWAMLACLSLYHGKLNVASSALCALQAVDKVEYIKHIQNIPTEEVSPNERTVVRQLTELDITQICLLTS